MGHPAERIAFMLADSRPALVLTTADVESCLRGVETAVVEAALDPTRI